MSSRVTRSATKRAAAEPSLAADTPTINALSPPSATKSRKRKTRDPSPDNIAETSNPRHTSSKRTKRQTIAVDPSSPSTQARPRGGGLLSTMAKPGSFSGNAVDKDKSPPPAAAESSRRKSSRSKKTASEPEAFSLPSSSTTKRSRKTSSKKPGDVEKDSHGTPKNASSEAVEVTANGNPSEDDDAVERQRNDDNDDDDDGDNPFRGGYTGPGGSHASMSSTLRAMAGYMSTVSQRLRENLNNLKHKDDPSVQLIALQELSEILLVSNEDNLSGQFSSDQFVKELITLMQPNEYGEANQEMILLACRCVANLMEALPPTTANVVFGGAVPILCSKLVEIEYIDVAEQALSTLEKISVEFPQHIVKDGGLTACLTYLDFFATSTQRTAVTTAANACKNIPLDCFDTVSQVMPILLNVLSSSDQKVVEQGSICVSRIVESFRCQPEKLAEMVQPDMLRAIRRLLQPGTTNLIGPNIHTQFLRVLSITAHASPKLSVELLKMSVVDTIYQILTGVSPPSDLEDVASQTDSVFVMQALIHRPREQIFETLNVICELLPAVQNQSLSFQEDLFDLEAARDGTFSHADHRSLNSERLRLLEGCKEELKRFAIILFPTLTDAYSSTVNLSVRQKVLTAQLKMLSNLDTSILEAALRTVPYASYLASILSQQDHPSLVTSALKAADLLLHRLASVYGYQFYREGVMAEVAKLANRPLTKIENKPKAINANIEGQKPKRGSAASKSVPKPLNDRITGGVHFEQISDHHEEGDVDDEDDEDEDDVDDDDDDNDDDGGPREIHDDLSASPSDSSSAQPSPGLPLASDQDLNTLRAKKFLEVRENAKSKSMREKAARILKELQALAANIGKCYHPGGTLDGAMLFKKLSKHFCGDALSTITSSELLHSQLVDVLLNVFNNPEDALEIKARSEFLEIFMAQPSRSSSNQGVMSTPFSVFIHKLQDLLSRAEHFEVITIHQNAQDNNRSSPSSMLSKQLRLKIMSDDVDETPRSYKDMTISIHAIATLKSLDDYLRPRVSLSGGIKVPRHREGVSHALAAFAAAAGIPNARHRLAERSLANREPQPLPTQPDTGASSRSTHKTLKTRTSTNPETPKSIEKSSTRRSSRRHQQVVPDIADEMLSPSSRVQSPLECADERQLTDEDDIDDSSALDAIVDDLDDGMEGEDLPDPTAVNMEVASTGKITPRKEDGSRIAASSQGAGASLQGLSARSRELLAAGISPSAAGRLSYSAAIQAVPQDWHLEFSLSGHPVPIDMTIYQAVLTHYLQPLEYSSRTMWSTVHTVKYKRVPGPPPPDASSSQASSAEASNKNSSALPLSLHEHPATSKILRLLNILHEINANLDDVLDECKGGLEFTAEPVSQFVNTKLTAKLNRQLEEPLIVASKSLPKWSEDLARLYPFLFPFETRHLFLQSTSFGYTRSMSRWQNQSTEDTRRDRHRDDRPFQGRLQRQKVRLSRTRILESAIKVMEMYGGSSSILEVEYFEEVGTGLGPTLEFYSTVSKEFSKKKNNMWRENDSNDQDEHVFGRLGLFPSPMTIEQGATEAGKLILRYFKALGRFIARSMLDSRIIDISLNPTFFRVGDQPSTVPLSLGALKIVDSDLAKSLKLLKKYASGKKAIDENLALSAAEKAHSASRVVINGAHVEDLGLDFTLPGYPNIELLPNGADTPVTIDNVGSYVDKVIDMTLGSGIQQQIDSFRSAFSEVFSYSALKAFTPSELVMLFGRNEEDWSIETLLDSIKADHGFNMDSKSVRNLLQVMSEISLPQRRDFLQFVTGSPKLPIGGFKSLNPMFTVVCKPSEPPYTSDDFLISVMTCANYVKLPDYSNIDILRKKLMTAIQEGQGAFHLS